MHPVGLDEHQERARQPQRDCRTLWRTPKTLQTLLAQLALAWRTELDIRITQALGLKPLERKRLMKAAESVLLLHLALQTNPTLCFLLRLLQWHKHGAQAVSEHAGMELSTGSIGECVQDHEILIGCPRLSRCTPPAAGLRATAGFRNGCDAARSGKKSARGRCETVRNVALRDLEPTDDLCCDLV